MMIEAEPILTGGYTGGGREAMLPLLAGFTHEDKEAKGLRAFREDDAGPRRPVHYTAAEMVFMFPALLLHAPHGGGKTAFARELSACIKGSHDGDALFNRARLTRSAFRNEAGDCLEQVLPQDLPQAFYCADGEDADAALADALAMTSGPVLLIVDALEMRPDPEALLTRLMAATQERLRLLVLCESRALEAIRRPASLPEHRLLGLARPERAAFAAAHDFTDPYPDRDYVLPGLWFLAVETGRVLAPREVAVLAPVSAGWASAYRKAAELERMPVDRLVEAVAAAPARLAAPLGLYCDWLVPGEERAEALVRGLAMIDGGLPVLLAAAKLAFPGSDAARLVTAALVHAIEAGGAAAGLRRRAGAMLARLGDPRDLEVLASVPAGTYPMGGDIHANSAPAHHAPVGAFRIGIYPVVNSAYLAFVEETGRSWVSANGRLADRASHPATDLTWHDARAYCAWLTDKWRAEGRIAGDETVRLPVEREWEAAARGADGLAWPWGNVWAPEHGNGEETGFNDISTVGLFPEGRSPFGCLDMAGQAWEWCTTLWGPDMSRPDFAFPWVEDGREALDAPGNIRRVLRGGCFSSPDWKANGIYRGSLEPSGFWRGNGFRVVVAKG
ncbi:SUMF1/EgtB/PvdO family nonheme iron enzyme [Martelella sp. HB161492]|uniref:SUMF1/EgtB/PvdO family nonheme iron enzyme n=1 Tax=Martelella sp. HB161492 TaxID=2720726 RepID=UPI0015927181|nr:SUMF1/EgtB/PvdO family nonheme iron enzyme [Martelella sp. HB161492]